MRRAMLFLILTIVFLVPVQAAFAQDFGFDSEIPSDCQPEFVLEEFMEQLMESSDLDSAMVALEYLVDRVMVCAEPWLMALLQAVEPLLSEMMGGVGPIELPPDLVLAPDDGVLTSDEAEYAINQAFAGNLAEANQFICESEQIEEDDAPPFSSVNEISCQEENGEMSCFIDAVVGGESFTATAIFQIEDGRLCENETIEE